MDELKKMEKKILAKSRGLKRFPVIYIIALVVGMAISFGLFLAYWWVPGIAIATVLLLGGAPLAMMIYPFLNTSLQRLTEKYRSACTETYLYNKMERCGVKNCHYKPEDGLWKDELVRAGLFDKNTMMEISSKDYIEGEIDNVRFRNSKIMLLQKVFSGKKKPAVTGCFWIFTVDREYPCRLAIFNRQLADELDRDISENRWCGSDGLFRRVNAEGAFYEQFSIYSDNPEEAVELLNAELQSRIEQYIEKHPKEAFFLGFHRKEMFFFDYAEEGIEMEFLREKMKRTSGREKHSPNDDNVYFISSKAEHNSNEQSKYLMDIIGIFAAPDGVMWNTKANINWDNTNDMELDIILEAEDARLKSEKTLQGR